MKSHIPVMFLQLTYSYTIKLTQLNSIQLKFSKITLTITVTFYRFESLCCSQLMQNAQKYIIKCTLNASGGFSVAQYVEV